MANLPQLIEEDVRQLDETLSEFVNRTEATVALVIDKGGFLIAHQGDAGDLDLTSIGALASGAFLANQTIASLVNEKKFNSLHQQGDHFSLFVMNVDDNTLLAVIFKSQTGVGVVKFYANAAVARLARQFAVARERAPDHSLDLSVLNVANPQELFRKKTA
jgi:predicted regulator of Ras-like GTPase activity (Roadblock/LC7/MglB family)